MINVLTIHAFRDFHGSHACMLSCVSCFHVSYSFLWFLMHSYAGLCRSMHIYADVCRLTLTHWDVCRRTAAFNDSLHLGGPKISAVILRFSSADRCTKCWKLKCCQTHKFDHQHKIQHWSEGGRGSKSSRKLSHLCIFGAAWSAKVCRVILLKLAGSDFELSLGELRDWPGNKALYPRPWTDISTTPS